MKKRKNFMKLLLATGCVILGLGAATVVQARAYISYETVTKSGASAVYSNSTGTNLFHVDYGASCASGTLYATVQYYTANGYVDIAESTKSLSAGETVRSASVYYSPYKIFRLKLSGVTGKGNGWIQGRE